MTAMLDTALLAFGGSLAVLIVAKATFALTIALAAVSLMRRSRAAARHLTIAAAFAVLVLLPVASLVGPTVLLEVGAESNATMGVPAVPTIDTQWSSDLGAPSARTPWAAFGARPGSASSLSMASLVASVWAAGAMLCLAPVVAGLWQLRRLRRISEPWPPGAALARQLAREAGISSIIDVRRRASLPGPMTYGVVRPVIILPADAHDWADDDVQRALVHELEHASRRLVDAGDGSCRLCAVLVPSARLDGAMSIDPRGGALV